MLRIALTNLFLLWSFPVTAEPAFVQSGEHVGFTRLVTKVSNQAKWNIEQDGRDVTLQFEGHSDGFDTSRIFDLIPKGRVERVDADQSSLTVHLGCDCSISAFDVAGGHVALDIISPEKNQRPPSAKKPELLLAKASASTTAKPHSPPLQESSPILRDALTQTERAVLSGLQSRLSEELGRATTRGVLNPNQKTTSAPRTQIDPAVFEHLLPAEPPRKNSQHMAENIRITTSMDVPKHPDSSEKTLTDQGFWCPPDDATNVADWGDTRSFDVQISEARTNIFGEFDRLDPDAAILLAKRYLYFGFGAEARQVLSLDASLTSNYQMLMDFAEIMETGGTASNLSIQSFADCTGNISLWAFLATANDGNSKAANPIIILRALNKLPVHLRQYIAPIVSKNFLTRGDTVSAATALRSLERLPDALRPSATLAQAHLGITSDNIAEGSKKLHNVATANVAESPSALVSLVNAKIREGETIDPETVGLVEAYAQELRGTDIGSDVQRALVLALIETLDFDRALIEIDAFAKSDPGDAAIEMRVKFAQKLTESASDIEFLDIVFRLSSEKLSPLDGPTKISLANRLLALGFASTANKIIESVPDRPRDPERQLLAAKIALALDHPFQALADLVGVNDQASDILRAQAKSMAGAHQEAYVIYHNADEQDAAAQSAWLARNWRDLTPTDAPIFGQISALATPISDLADEQIGMLSRTTAALEESGAARQTIVNFLDAPELRAIPE